MTEKKAPARRQTQGLLWHQGRFSATKIALRINGNPSLREWSQTLRTLVTMRTGMQWAVGDALLFADTRKQWDDGAVEEVLDATRLKRGTLMNLKAIAKAFPAPRRHEALPWSHHQLVASLPNEAQDELLAKSHDKNWGWEEMREHAKARRHAQKRLAQEFPQGTYGLLLAEPRWPKAAGDGPTMKPAEIAALGKQVKKITAPDAVCFLRVPTDRVEDGLDVLRAWGFAYETLAHVTLLSGYTRGPWLVNRKELMLIGTHGDPAPPEDSRLPDVDWENQDAVGVLNYAFPDVPKIRLFSTEAHEGWQTWGHTLEAEAVATEKRRGRRSKAEQPEPEVTPELVPA